MTRKEISQREVYYHFYFSPVPNSSVTSSLDQSVSQIHKALVPNAPVKTSTTNKRTLVRKAPVNKVLVKNLRIIKVSPRKQSPVNNESVDAVKALISLHYNKGLQKERFR